MNFLRVQLAYLKALQNSVLQPKIKLGSRDMTPH